MIVNAEFQRQVAENLLYLDVYVEWGSERIGDETWMKILIVNSVTDDSEDEFIFREAGEFKGRPMLEVKFYNGTQEPLEAFIEATPIAFSKIVR